MVQSCRNSVLTGNSSSRASLAALTLGKDIPKEMSHCWAIVMTAVEHWRV
jgi:hypothetical protein